MCSRVPPPAPLPEPDVSPLPDRHPPPARRLASFVAATALSSPRAAAPLGPDRRPSATASCPAATANADTPRQQPLPGHRDRRRRRRRDPDREARQDRLADPCRDRGPLRDRRGRQRRRQGRGHRELPARSQGCAGGQLVRRNGARRGHREDRRARDRPRHRRRRGRDAPGRDRQAPLAQDPGARPLRTGRQWRLPGHRGDRRRGWCVRQGRRPRALDEEPLRPGGQAAAAAARPRVFYETATSRRSTGSPRTRSTSR